MTIKELQQAVLKLAEEKGFGTTPEMVNVGEKIALIHTELSEAFEAYRKQHMDGKDGFREELADVLIRTIHLAGIFEIDLEQEIAEKMERNQGRTWDWDRLKETRIG
ncbi:hypothetical protein GF380_01815 [Candidatus Uhrbacteria bacterium]|nr:hypothetical protein [Candidatus Uhrbacteria bacterium]